MGKILRAIKNNEYGYSIITRIFSVLSGLTFSILFSRYFQPELRGEYSVITTYAEFAVLFMCIGMYQAYPFYKKKERGKIYHEFINIVFAFFIIYLLGAFALFVFFYDNVGLQAVVVLAPFMFAIQQLNYVVLIENPKIRNTFTVILSLFDNVLVIIFMLSFQKSMNVLLLFLFFKEIVYFYVAVENLGIQIKEIRPSFRGAGKYLRFGFIPMVTVLMMDLNYKADVAMLDYFGVSNAEIGVYALGLGLAQKIWMLPDALKDILLSRLAKGKTEEEVCKIIRISLWAVSVLGMILIVCGKMLISLLFGEAYTGAYDVMAILLCGVIGMIFYKMIYSFNVIQGRQKANLFILGTAAGVNVAANYVLIPSDGIQGAALASLASYLFCGIGFLVYFVHVTGCQYKSILLLQQADFLAIKTIFHKV